MSTPLQPLLALPRELRDLIYHLLWTTQDRVAAHWSQGGTGNLACYLSGTKHKNGVVSSPQLMHANRKALPQRDCKLPQWPLTCREILQEGLEQFRRKATWNLWPLIGWASYSTETGGLLMAPRFARSIALHRLALEPIVSWRDEKSDKRTLSTSFGKSDTKWLENLAESLMTNNEVSQLISSFGLPWAWYAGGGYHVDIQLGPWLRLLQAYGSTLSELSVEVCRKVATAPGNPFGGHDISISTFDEVWDCIKQAIGDKHLSVLENWNIQRAAVHKIARSRGSLGRPVSIALKW